MKWGDSFEVETGTFWKNSGMRLEFRGTQRDCIRPYNLFYLIKYPGLKLGEVKMPIEEQAPDGDERYARTMGRLAQQRWEESQ